jgi:EAL domain-containing protein (putative c-di-GMP-specific phosphodiesterase class I)
VLGPSPGKAAGMSNIANLLFPPRAAEAASLPHPTGAREEIGDMIEALRARLDMDVAFVSRQIGTTHRIFTHVAARGVAPLRTGDYNPNENSLCWLVIEGKLPERVTDTSLYDVAACLPITEAINVRAHFSVPLRRRDGRVHGSLCCFSYRPRPDVGEREMQIIRSLAAIVSDQIEGRIELEERGEDAGREIENLIWEDDLMIIHQPIYDLTDWHLVGYECLMRQKANPDRSPLELLERARTAGKVLELELHAARKALATLDPAFPERFVAINVSPATLASAALAQLIPEGLESRLVIELNHQETATRHAELKAAIAALKERAWVAVSSEGAGLAGLQALVDLGPDIVKIDGDFLGGLAADPARRALVKALVQFAGETEVTLIAQGVETREDLQVLRDLGVRFAQGNILGKPVVPGRGGMVC